MRFPESCSMTAQLLRTRQRAFNLHKVLATPSLTRCTTHTAINHETAQAGDHKSGHIEAGPNEGVLFFDNVFPLKLRWLLRLPLFSDKYFERVHGPRVASFDPEQVVRQSFPNDDGPMITGVIPRLKEGGSFVRFTHDANSSSEGVALQVREHLKKNKIRPWFRPLQHVRTNLVRGRPWIEDLYRPPACRLRVEFVQPETGDGASELSQEQLYSIFRPYGRLTDIISQPPDSKIVPRYAYLDFADTNRAIMAKNCVHGFIVREDMSNEGLVKLKLSYEKRAKSNWFSTWIFNHPRIVIPVLAALVAGFTVAIFDPIRTFSIKAHITRAFHVSDSRIFKWFVRQASDLLPLHGRNAREPGMQAIWDDRRESIEQIQTWLMETEDTFIIIQGPRGAGKRELVVDQALKDRANTLVIDCKPLQEARTDSNLIDATARQVGYRPVFSWMNQISGLIDLAAQGATGMKTGFSETVETQLDQILNNTSAALREIGLESRKDDEDTDTSDDAYLDAHPERRPVVIIDNFLHKSQESGIVYDKLAEWAAQITTANVAHVIFLTTDVSYSKSLSRALPDRVFRQMSLGDCSPEVARRFVVSHLSADDQAQEQSESPTRTSGRREDLAELDQCLALIGGRLTDLEFLARRIKAGETPTRAVQEIVDQSTSEILKMYIIGDSSQRQWTPEQAWVLIKLLADNENLPYNEIILSDGFSPDNADSVLQGLEQAEMINVVSLNGRPYLIKPGKPVYFHAFKRLREDAVLASRLDLAILTEQIKQEAASIEKAENELNLIGQLPKQPTELVPRIQYLLRKVQVSQSKIERLEARTADLKKVLLTKY